MPANDKNYSRPIPHTFTGVQWCAIEGMLALGVCTATQFHSPTMRDKAAVVADLMAEINKLVDAAKQLEPTGSGLDHPSRKHW